MRKSPTFRVLGGGALALGLVAVGTTIATTSGGSEISPVSSDSADSADTATTADDQLTALQRDLDLSATEATRLLDTEAKARKLDSELRRNLGDDFGGSRFDIDSGDLTVAVTDKAAVDTVEKAGATAQVVTYGESGLDKIVDDLNEEGASLSEGVTGWYPSATDDAVVITVLKGKEAAAEKLIADAGVETGAVTVEETTDKPRTYADILGGDAYIINGSGRCSIGFAVEGGFATAGHCGAKGTPVAAQSGGGTGTVAESHFPGRDMGYVQTDAGWTPTGFVNDHNGGTVAVTGSQEAPEGSSVCRSGSTTGWHCGTIGAKNQTVVYPEGRVEGLTQTDVCAEPGDSGGSWISDDQAQGVTSGGSGNCTAGGVTYFQPLNPILQEWNLTLSTS
ncbi:S1 family peptidase [Nocardiopsis gilva YIM 90087]|uniref:S1 family peptidase n=1 Tax=Nocardiopsis gilva YIM 90087 TaxID=1235441 RepID=A0A223S3H1_9ACTN|nr:S1 family peptidase [Nocardiopsis gilva]ASU82668.1 S1 family peptidase [Nocardiopsis gilva YIM 90087]